MIRDAGFTAIIVGNFLCTGIVTLFASIKRVNYQLNVEAHGRSSRQTGLTLPAK